ncbi:UNKNOWN [Stylonychia lemnae]|uniref:Uncharacterized protein n=1 Tax=Stylonychia lemnae TaxID=5949 RepID=A0A078AWC9_STYLE|nr:UNKNOWN [Stylonychia lemnae]|eukprot:CDW86449.1 UNKNOWN [Stylonychia lemnae]
MFNDSQSNDKPPRIFYFQGAEFYFNTLTGNLKQYMNYRCRDYNCNGSLKFHISKDINLNPKILRTHTASCKELKKQMPKNSISEQLNYHQKVHEEVLMSSTSLENELSIYERLLQQAKSKSLTQVKKYKQQKNHEQEFKVIKEQQGSNHREENPQDKVRVCKYYKFQAKLSFYFLND